MSWTVPIVALGVGLLVALTFIVVRGELHAEGPWEKFAGDHGLEFHAEQNQGARLAGAYRGRDLEIREISVPLDNGDRGRVAQVSADIDLPPELRILRRTPEPVPPDGRIDLDREIPADELGLGASFYVTDAGTGRARELFGPSEVGERIVELLEAEPRLGVLEGRLHYWDPTGLRDRRDLRRFVDRVVDSVDYIERGETRT